MKTTDPTPPRPPFDPARPGEVRFDDPRVVLEIAGALSGVALGWQWFSKKTTDADAANSTEKTDA